MMNQMRQQPFFKPLNVNSEMASTNLYESVQQNTANQSKSNVNVHSFQINRHKENNLTQCTVQQDSMIGGERLSSLHAKLQQEADKIRKWRVQTEIELKQKESNIKELTGTVESLRKSILELQLQNESLSLKLQEEMSNREEVMQKVCATRDICNLLKDHSAKTEERLQKCETERTELKYMEKEHLKQFEELSVQFKNLEIAANEKQSKLANELSVVKSEHEVNQQEMEEKLSSMESSVKSLSEQSDEKDIEIRDIRSILQQNEEQIHTLESTHDELKENLDCCQNELNQKKESFEVTVKQLQSVEEQYGELTEKSQNLTKELEALQAAKEKLENEIICNNDKFTNETNVLQLELQSLNLQLNEKICRIIHLEEEMEKSLSNIEELKSAKDLLIMERAEIENKLQECEKSKEALLISQRTGESKAHHLLMEIEKSQEELKLCQTDCLNHKNEAAELKKTIDVLLEEKSELQKEIISATEEINLKKVDLERAREEIQQNKENESKLSDEIAELKDNLEQECGNYDNTLKDLKKAKTDIATLEKKLTTKQKDFDKIQKEIEKRKKSEEGLVTDLKEKKQEKEMLSEELDNVKKELEEKCSIIIQLEEEKEANSKTMQGELKNLSKDATDLEVKTKSLKTDITAKNKHIKELEKETRGLKSKLTAQTKLIESKEEEMDRIKEDLESVSSTVDDLKNSINQQEKDLCQEKKRADQEKKKADEMKMLADKSVKEQEMSSKKCEMQMAEMMATLEKYKQDNHKILSQREKEFELLKQKFESGDKDAKIESKKVVSELQGQIEDFKKKLCQADSQKVEWEKKIEEKDKQLSEVQSEVQTKEKKIAELSKKIKVHHPPKKTVSLQTSPVLPPTATVTPVPSTPSVTQKPVFVTPKVTQMASLQRTPKKPETPVMQSEMKTPQRSILKSAMLGSASKKRRVVFAQEKEDVDSDSSSSELMELEIDEIESRYKTKDRSTPLLLHPSPKVYPSPKHVKENSTPRVNRNEMENTDRLTITRVPRGPPVSIKRKEKQNECRTPSSKSLKLEESKILNVRKTPSKTHGKFFKNSPKERMKKPKSDETETSWFDLDSVFGFGPED
ncbi:hypothetical protein ScPMuIL_012030 [Solemya velum]